jgi:Fe-S oxidoreductase
MADKDKQQHEAQAERVTEAGIASAVDAFRSKIDHRLAASLNSCVHCGLCAESCHYYLATGNPDMQPALKVKLLQAVYRWHFTASGRLLSSLTGAARLDQAMIQRWIDTLFGSCTMCGRCTLNCTVGLDISRLVRAGRSALVSLNLVPSGLQSTVNTAVDKGNNMGIAKEEWLETAQWIQEELQQDVGDPEARIPIDQEDVRFLYTVNPREIKFFPLSLLAAAKILYASGERWTFSSDYYDVTNYGLFSGDDSASALISGRLHQTMGRLRAGMLVLGECGHGYNAHHWEAPEWLAVTPGYESRSIVRVIADFLRRGQITLDPARNAKRVTLHDPCNLVRLGGVIEDQRFILRRAAADFVEMYPNREKNFCCGGGGGQLSMTTFARRRLEAGKIKAEQIARTGAKIVVTPCHNCIDQLSELNKEYKLGVEVKTLSEVVADALVLGADTSKQRP